MGRDKVDLARAKVVAREAEWVRNRLTEVAVPQEVRRCLDRGFCRRGRTRRRSRRHVRVGWVGPAEDFLQVANPIPVGVGFLRIGTRLPLFGEGESVLIRIG